MAEIVKIALTGGPCSGKSSALNFLKNRLEEFNMPVFTVEEAAERLMKSGKTPENMGSYEFHKLLFETELENENKMCEQAKKLDCGKAVIICDRGLLDSRAYVTEDEFKRYSALFGLNEDLIRNRYDAVFHLVTAANGAQEHYSLDNNSIRRETPEQATALDDRLLSIWTGTQHLRIIDNSTDFEAKLERLLTEVLAVLGIPKPLEIERKFLIEYPDLKLLQGLNACRRIPITQAYLDTPEEGNIRIRKRGEGDGAAYIKTKKIKLSEIKRVEIEDYISFEEYNAYMSRRECISGIISKDRYCIAYNSFYYELDVYPFWDDRATLEIELLSETQPYSLPPFVKLIREVTTEPDYRNYALAKKYGGKI